MKKHILFFVMFFLLTKMSFGQGLKTENIVLITLDGFRWQEVFTGADSSLIFHPESGSNANTQKTFWHRDVTQRREKLMPFFWNVIGKQGQLYGNRAYGNKVNCANPYGFSYPGYSELLVGYVDIGVNSNRKEVNPNRTVLEYIHEQPAFQNRVAVFSTWDVMSYIIRDSISGIFTNCGLENSTGSTETQLLLNELQQVMKNHRGHRPDAFTFYHAFEYIKHNQPRMVFISLDETDDHAHGGRYGEYLNAAHRSDQMIAMLWNWIQADPQYKDKTTLIITTDHGRGKGIKGWQNHGKLLSGASQIWFAAIGPDTPATGEMKHEDQLHQKQLAKTMAALLGLSYENERKVGDVVADVFYKPFYTAQQ